MGLFVLSVVSEFRKSKNKSIQMNSSQHTGTFCVYPVKQGWHPFTCITNTATDTLTRKRHARII